MTEADKVQTPNEVKQIIRLPFDERATKLQDSIGDQFRAFIEIIDGKIKTCREKMQESVCVFAVNHIQNRFIAAEMAVEVANLFEILQVRRVSDFQMAIENLKGDAETADLMGQFTDCIGRWDTFLEELDGAIDEKIGPTGNSPPPDGQDSRSPFAYMFSAESPFELFLISIVRTFTGSEITTHITALYNKMEEMRGLGCDVHLLTRGPSIGTRGGSYLKLIGVPFRKICDENQAQAELRSHRQRAKRIAGWAALLALVESTIADEAARSKSRQSENKEAEVLTESATFLAAQHGVILVDRGGRVHFKYVEDEDKKDWPAVELLMGEIRRVRGVAEDTTGEGNAPADSGKGGTDEKPSLAAQTSKVDSDISEGDRKEKECCTIL